jgi:hypothetical protein
MATRNHHLGETQWLNKPMTPGNAANAYIYGTYIWNTRLAAKTSFPRKTPKTLKVTAPAVLQDYGCTNMQLVSLTH